MESWWDPTEPHRDRTSALHLNPPYTPLPFSRIPKAHSWSWIGLRQMVLQYLGPTFQLPLGVHRLRHWAGDQLPPKTIQAWILTGKSGNFMAWNISCAGLDPSAGAHSPSLG